MTVSNNYAPDVSNGNGATVVYTGNWKVFNASFFRLIYQDIATGVQTPKTLGVDYTLTFDPNSPGYSITLTAPAGVTNQVIRARQIDLTQTTPYRTSKGFQGNNEETSFDKLTSITQDIQEQVGRSLKFPVGATAIGALPVPVDQAVLTWSGVNGTLINGPTVGQIANAATNATTATAAASAAINAQAAAEAAANGMKWRPTVRAATTAALPACTYANGASGIGATLTGNANGALAAQDAIALIVGQDLLVKNQAAPLQNGVYRLTQLGDAGTPFILTRRTDADTWAELEGQVIVSEEGGTQADTPFICTVDLGGTVGVTAITWTVFPVALIDGTVTNAKLANMLANTIKSNSTGATAAPSDLAIAANTFPARASTGNLAAKPIDDGTLDVLANGAWITTFVPTITSESGAFTSVNASCRYKQIGKIVFVEIRINVVTAGTAATGILATLPVACNAAGVYNVTARENAITGFAMTGTIGNISVNQVQLRKYDSTYLGASGAVIIATGIYEAA